MKTPVLLAAGALWLTCSCTVIRPVGDLGYSHYPEDFQVIGPTSGMATTHYVLGITFRDEGGVAGAYRKAIELLPDANGLINIASDQSSFTFLGLYSTRTIRVNGTAIRTEDSRYRRLSPEAIRVNDDPFKQRGQERGSAGQLATDPLAAFIAGHLEFSSASPAFQGKALPFQEIQAAYREFCRRSALTPLSDEELLEAFRTQVRGRTKEVVLNGSISFLGASLK